MGFSDMQHGLAKIVTRDTGNVVMHHEGNRRGWGGGGGGEERATETCHNGMSLYIGLNMRHGTPHQHPIWYCYFL